MSPSLTEGSTMKFYALTLAAILTTPFAQANSNADTIDLNGFTEQQSVIVQSQLNLFSEIAESKITSANHQQFANDLQVLIYCGYEAFSNDQAKFAKITKSNEDFIFDNQSLKNKYKTLISYESKLPNDLSVCSAFHGTQVALNYGSQVMDELF